jgi:hypothetical protein
VFCHFQLLRIKSSLILKKNQGIFSSKNPESEISTGVMVFLKNYENCSYSAFDAKSKFLDRFSCSFKSADPLLELLLELDSLLRPSNGILGGFAAISSVKNIFPGDFF